MYKEAAPFEYAHPGPPKKENAEMITSALSGKFKDDSKLRKEFLSLIKEN